MMEWRPIKTAPKTTRARLVWCPERQNIYIVTWDRDAWIFFGGGGVLSQEATHWMPLPEPPEVG